MPKNKCVYKMAREEKLKRLKVRRLTLKEEASEKKSPNCIGGKNNLTKICSY